MDTQKTLEIPLTQIEGSIQVLGYDSATQTMVVRFNSGGVYHFHDVPPGAHQEFLNAE